MKNKQVEDYFSKNKAWKNEIKLLREICLSTGLEETLKWNFPVYTFNSKIVVGISAFKSYFGLWFFQGALLNDERKVLINAQHGKTKAMRQWRFTASTEVDEKMIKQYIQVSVQNIKDGKEIKPYLKKPLLIPPELANILKKDNELFTAFEKLSLSKKREYAEYILDAKRTDTKQRRIQKIVPMIKNGKGLNDRYR